MTRYNLRLTGTINTLSPIAIVPPGTDEIKQADGSKYKKIASMLIYNDGLRDTRPIIPGSTLRGRLRRSAVEVYMAGTGTKPSLAEWHQNAVGGIKGAEKEAGHDVTMRDQIREKNLVLSLFGAGAPWIMSKAKIDNAVPTHAVETSLVGGVRADDGRRKSDFFQTLNEDAADEWMAMVSVNAERTKNKKKLADLNTAIRQARKAKNTDEVDRLMAERKAFEEDKDNQEAQKTNSVSMIMTHEALPLGVNLEHGMTLSAVTEDEIGLFFCALNGMMKGNPAIGQHENLGYGLFSAQYNVTLEDVADFDPFVIGATATKDLGTLSVEPFEGITSVSDEIVGMMKGFKNALDNGNFDFSEIKK